MSFLDWDLDEAIEAAREEGRNVEQEKSRQYFLELLNQDLTIEEIKERFKKEGILIEGYLGEGSFIDNEDIDKIYKLSKEWENTCKLGDNEDKLKTAKIMLEKWLPPEFVQKITGLPMKEIKKSVKTYNSNLMNMMYDEYSIDISIAINRKETWEEAREEDRQYFLELLNQDLTKEEIRERLQESLKQLQSLND